MLTVITGWFLVAAGALLGAGGAWLAVLGGSWAYIGLGIGLAATGILLAWQRRAALGVYAALLVGTLIWAIWEVGLERWALVPRGAFFAVVGLWLLGPWISRSLNRADAENTPARITWRNPRGWLAGAMGLVIATTLISMLRDPFDIGGRLPAAPAAAQAVAPASVSGASGDDWLAYGGTGHGQRYSLLADITTETVSQLEAAWTFHTGDVRRPTDPTESTFEVTPLKVGDTLYLCTPHSWVIALDAATGRERWRFDPQVNVDKSSQHLTCRGVAYFDASQASGSAQGASPPSTSAQSACTRRIFLPTIDARLFALDAQTGQKCGSFGDGGVVRLDVGTPNLSHGAYMMTSPPVVTRELVIVGSSINDNVSVNNPSGVIRAFDSHTGRLVWNWDSGNPEATAPLASGRQYTAGGPNSWSISSVDEELGLLYLPMGNESPDQLGSERSPQVERFSSSIVALEVATGRVRWVFQAVHHDLWDRDMPAQPTLVNLTRGGDTVPALVAPTKQGEIFVLDRRNGQPVLPVREVAVPVSTMPGTYTAPTQPTSALSFMPPVLLGKDMWGATPWDQLWCRIQFHSMHYQGPYTPPSTRRTLVYPGNAGVFNWGGVAVDPVAEVVVGAPSYLAFTFQLVPREQPEADLVSDGNEPFNENYGARYAVKIGAFMSPFGLPCQQPPWGAIGGADLRTGEIAWLHRNGTVRDLMPPFLPFPFKMGVASLGGPLITAGGVMFYSGTQDDYLRAYDLTTGRQLWQSRLPAGGQATPMTYRADGKQMVVVAAGGHGSFGTTLGDAVIAYALPSSQ